jgi:hypothetical protein
LVIADGVRNAYIISVGDLVRNSHMGGGMMIDVREVGREIHAAGNWNVLMDRMQNVVVCRDDWQGSVSVCVLACLVCQSQ